MTSATHDGYVALTFDDGPHPESTARLLEALVARDCLATFFVCGENVENHPDLLRALHTAGMWIGNHSFSHPRLPELDEAAAFAELTSTQQAVERVTGHAPTLSRPPYGLTDDRTRAQQARLGLTEVLWTIDTRDWDGASADDIRRAAALARPGDTVLMHDGGYQPTVDALPRLLDELADRGLRPGRIDAATGRAVAPMT